MTSLAILVDNVDNDDIPTPQNYSHQLGTPAMADIPMITMTCDHCHGEYDNIGAPLACGDNICSCYCAGECPEIIAQQFAHVEYDRVMEELLWIVLKYE